MKRVLWSLSIPLAVGLSFSNVRQVPNSGHLGASRQHLLVVTETESAPVGAMYRYSNESGRWKQVGDAVPVVVGANGVGKTREGDKRAPTGAYRLTAAFGYAEESPPWLRMPYIPLREETECVDDADSNWYNQIVNPSRLPGGKTWKSSELMRRDLHHGDDLYKLGLVVDYNPTGARDPASGKGAGSCIFLHIWRGEQQPTAGCTAFSESVMIDLLNWLDPEAVPLLIQGQRKDFLDLTRQGKLPYAPPGR